MGSAALRSLVVVSAVVTAFLASAPGAAASVVRDSWWTPAGHPGYEPWRFNCTVVAPEPGGQVVFHAAPRGIPFGRIPDRAPVQTVRPASQPIGHSWYYVADRATQQPIGWVSAHLLACN